MATFRTDYYVLWNTDEGEKYYKAEKKNENNTSIKVKYIDGTYSYFKKDIVNKEKTPQGLTKVISNDVWQGAESLRALSKSPPEGANQVAHQPPQEGAGGKRRKKHRKKKGSGRKKTRRKRSRGTRRKKKRKTKKKRKQRKR